MQNEQYDEQNPSSVPFSPAPETRDSSPRESKMLVLLKEVIIFALVVFGVVLPFRVFVAEPYVVDGRSMDPTFHTGDYLIVDKLSYRFRNPARNSVIVFKFPTQTNRDLIKRVIGLPGDTVSIKGNTVTIKNTENPDGFTLDQSYVTHNDPGNFSVTLGPDEFFVMGDNRAESYDSRSWGILPRSDILGRPVLQLFPLDRISVLPGDKTEDKNTESSSSSSAEAASVPKP